MTLTAEQGELGLLSIKTESLLIVFFRFITRQVYGFWYLFGIQYRFAPSVYYKNSTKTRGLSYDKKISNTQKNIAFNKSTNFFSLL